MPGNKLIFALPVLIALAIAGSGSRGDTSAAARTTMSAPDAVVVPPDAEAPDASRAILTWDGSSRRLAPRRPAVCAHDHVLGLEPSTDDVPGWDDGEPVWHRQARLGRGAQASPCVRAAPGSFHGSI